MRPADIVRRHPVAAVHVVVALSIVLVAVGFTAFGMFPMGVRLSKQIDREIDFFRESAAVQLRAAVGNHLDIASHTASRTVIRQRLAAYNRGDVALEEMVAFSAPKLAEGLQAAGSARGVSRFDAQGRLVIQLGEPVDERYFLARPDGLSATVVRGPVSIRGASRLLYYTPLAGQDRSPIGYDIIVMDDQRVREVVEAPFGETGALYLLQDAHMLYAGAGAGAGDRRAAALADYLAGRRIDRRYRIDSVAIDPPGWDLYLAVDMNVFRAPIVREALGLTLYVIAATAGVLLLAVIVLRPVLRALQGHDRLVEQTRTDGLTGLANHDFLIERLAQELARAERHGSVLSLLFFDLDHFKDVNDRYGHQCGDEVLREVADILRGGLRQSDVAGRYGGEEFAVILPETAGDNAFVLAHRIRQRVQTAEFARHGASVKMTISAGVASYPGRGRMTAGELIDAADAALYESKRAGRNRVSKAA